MRFSCADGTSFQVDEQDRDLAESFAWFACRDPRSGEIAIRRNRSRCEHPQRKQRKVALHQEIAKRMGIHAPFLVDHKDRDKTNNCRSNLRPATVEQNQWNRRKMPRSGVASSVYKGVSFSNDPRRTKKPWRCALAAHGKRYTTFHETEAQAARRYDELARKYHGEFAVLNFPTCQNSSVTPNPTAAPSREAPLACPHTPANTGPRIRRWTAPP
jgi:hypothetical protein